MTRTLRKGNLQKSEKATKSEIKINADNMNVNQGYKKTELVCRECGATITVDNSLLEEIQGTIHCPICVLRDTEVDDEISEDEISIDELAEQVKKLTKLSQQQIEIQQQMLTSLGI